MPKRSRFSRQIIIVVSIFLLAVNGCLGVILIAQSKNALQSMLHKRMLDLSNSAAALLDGDVLESLTKEDEQTKPYQDSLAILRAFQEQVELRYIYGIRDMGDGTFTFTIDPTVEDPGEFGEPIMYTDALYQASLGIPSVDKVPYKDKWGRFYSAYSPVFNSAGKVAGIVAIDIDADWYERQLRRHIYTILIVFAVALIAGGVIVFLINSSFKRRFGLLNSEISSLTDDVEEFASELSLASVRYHDGTKQEETVLYDEEVYASGDDFEQLESRLKFVQKELQQYIIDAHELSFTDTLTGSGNRNSYIETEKRLNALIKAGKGSFLLGVFDINGLKTSNDVFGHEYGDLLIITAAEVLKETFGFENLFRIGGDEFVTILEPAPAESVEEFFKTIDAKIALRNEEVDEFKTKAPLAISKGASTYIKGRDLDVKSVFRRADKGMYEDKANYYKTHDRRSN